MKQIVFLLEEPSAKAMLDIVARKILREDIAIRFIVFEGKQDLEKRLELKLKAWRIPDTCFIVMRDQDSGDCLEIKRNLQIKVDASGKRDMTLIRIACRELESFYLGDLKAVERALNIAGLAKKQTKAKYREPDSLTNASEELSKLTDQKYHKLSGSRSIAPYMDLDNNKSYSFKMLVEGIKKIQDSYCA